MLKSISTRGGNPIVVTSGAMAINALYVETLQVFYSLRWAILFIIVLVFTDFWSGLTASVKVRKENFRLSRALRRTIAKFLEYINYIIFGLLLAKGTLEPFNIGSDVTGGAIGAIFALFIEADSIYGHICDIHGIRKRISIKRFIVAYIKRKSEDVGQAVEESLGEDKKSDE